MLTLTSQRDISILVSELLPAILQVDTVALCLQSKEGDLDVHGNGTTTATSHHHKDHNIENGGLEYSKNPAAGGSEVGLMSMTHHQFDDVPLFTECPLASESKIVLIDPQHHDHHHHLYHHQPPQDSSSSSSSSSPPPSGLGASTSADADADAAYGVLLIKRTRDGHHPPLSPPHR